MAGPIGYMERTRRYYEAQGFEKAYAWARFDDIPFTPLRTNPSRSRRWFSSRPWRCTTGMRRMCARSRPVRP